MSCADCGCVDCAVSTYLRRVCPGVGVGLGYALAASDLGLGDLLPGVEQVAVIVAHGIGVADRGGVLLLLLHHRHVFARVRGLIHHPEHVVGVDLEVRAERLALSVFVHALAPHLALAVHAELAHRAIGEIRVRLGEIL